MNIVNFVNIVNFANIVNTVNIVIIVNIVNTVNTLNIVFRSFDCFETPAFFEIQNVLRSLSLRALCIMLDFQQQQKQGLSA